MVARQAHNLEVAGSSPAPSIQDGALPGCRLDGCPARLTSWDTAGIQVRLAGFDSQVSLFDMPKKKKKERTASDICQDHPEEYQRGRESCKSHHASFNARLPDSPSNSSHERIAWYTGFLDRRSELRLELMKGKR